MYIILVNFYGYIKFIVTSMTFFHSVTFERDVLNSTKSAPTVGISWG